jgi:4-amino-4-deoxy-L-arabinose transferase-like glycosyltransferase
MKEQKLLYLIIFFSLFIRLLIAFPGLVSNKPERFFFRPDSGGYIQPALALLATGRYNVSPDCEKSATTRAPGFPAFLAGLFAISKEVRFPVIVFCLLSSLTCLSIFYTGRLLGGAMVGFIAATLFCLNITSIAISPLYLSDTIFVFFSAWQLYFFARFYFKGKLYDLWFATVLYGIATLIRPVSLLWIIPCAFLVLIFTRITFAKRLTGIAGCIIISICLLLPWMLRNQSVGAGFRLETNVSADTIHYYYAALLSKVTGESTESIKKRRIAEAEKEFTTHPERYPDEDARIQYMLEETIEVIRKHPFTYIKLHLFPVYLLLPDVATFFELLNFTQEGRGTVDILTRKGIIPATKHYFGDKIWLLFLVLPLLFVVFITYLGCAIQLCLWIIQKKWSLFFLFLAFVYYYLVLPGPVTAPRFHLPALPLMSVMSAMVICRLKNRRR